MANLIKDVYRGYKFSVKIAGFDRASFQKVTGMKSSVEVVEYREGNMPDRMEKFAGMMTYDAVTLERGISHDDDFRKWMEQTCDVINGSPLDPVAASRLAKGDFGDSYRKDVTITLHDKKGMPVKQYTLLGAFPSEYTVGDFDATSNDVVISSLVLQHHGIKEQNLA